jgi:uncharacterized protein
MKNSPFIYGSTVSAQSFADREEELKKLVNNLTGGINTMVISPRRWGKSSLVDKAAAKIRSEHKGIKIAVIDLFTVNSEEEFLEKFAGEVLKSASSKWEEWVKNSKRLFKNLVPRIQISPDPSSSFSISFDWNEIKKHSDEILDLPEKIAAEKKIKLIICLDEFQVIASFSSYEEMEKKMRAVWQRQKHVTYCIYGSQRHMMTDIFNNPAKPFYRFGDIVMLQKISRESWVSFICESFSATAKKISEDEAMMIADLMQCHSWYVQQLAHYTWNMARTAATKTDIIRALNEVMNANMPLYQKEVEILSTTQLNLLKAVASGERRLTSWNVMESYHLGTPRNVSKNRDILLARDIISESGAGYIFLDPVFELWFRKNFLNLTSTGRLPG